MLNLHYALGLVVFLAALVAIVNALARRLVVYLLALQIVAGILTWWMTKAAPPPAHWILALLVGGVYPLANAFERRGRPRSVAMAFCAVGAAVFALIIYLGMRALRT